MKRLYRIKGIMSELEHGFSGVSLLKFIQSRTGFATQFLTFNISKAIEASKRFGRLANPDRNVLNVMLLKA